MMCRGFGAIGLTCLTVSRTRDSVLEEISVYKLERRKR